MTQVRHITTTDARRARQWERVFGTAVLPVLHPRARFVTGEDSHNRPMYDLALSHLTTWQRERLAADIARRTQRPYADVIVEIQARPSYPITARDCHVVVLDSSPEETAVYRPSLW